MPTFSISFGSSKKNATATSPKGKGRKAAKPPTDTGTAIALAMAAVNSALDDSVIVPGVNRPLADLRVKAEGLRPNGTFGAWYPNCHEVAIADRQAGTAWLKSQPTKPKASGPRKSTEVDLLKAEVAALRAAVAGPTVAEGHTMVAEPAKPVEPLHILAEGQIIGFGNDLFEVAIAKNGKPFFRSA